MWSHAALADATGARSLEGHSSGPIDVPDRVSRAGEFGQYFFVLSHDELLPGRQFIHVRPGPQLHVPRLLAIRRGDAHDTAQRLGFGGVQSCSARAVVTQLLRFGADEPVSLSCIEAHLYTQLSPARIPAQRIEHQVEIVFCQPGICRIASQLEPVNASSNCPRPM